MNETRIEDPDFGTLTVRDQWGGLQGRATLPLPVADWPLTLDPEACAISERQREALRGALALTPAARQRLEELLYEDYAEIAGNVTPEPPPIASLAEVWEHVRPHRFAITEHRAARHRYFALDFDADWEEEHGCTVVFRDGMPLLRTLSGSMDAPEVYDAADAETEGE